MDGVLNLNQTTLYLTSRLVWKVFWITISWVTCILEYSRSDHNYSILHKAQPGINDLVSIEWLSAKARNFIFGNDRKTGNFTYFWYAVQWMQHEILSEVLGYQSSIVDRILRTILMHTNSTSQLQFYFCKSERQNILRTKYLYLLMSIRKIWLKLKSV